MKVAFENFPTVYMVKTTLPSKGRRARTFETSWDFANYTPAQKNRKNRLKGAVGSADLKIIKSALLSLNHHNFSNTKPIYTE